MVQLANFLAQLHASHHSSSRAAQPPPQRNRVLDMDVRLDGEAALVVASQDVERNPGDEVVLRIQANIVGAFTLALVRHSAVERVFGPGLGAINRDMQLEVHGEGKANDVEAGPNVGAGAGRLDHE